MLKVTPFLWSVVGVAIFLSACNSSDALKPAIRTSNFEFGTIDDAGKIIPTTKIPNKWGQTYGWQVNVDAKDSEVHCKEVITSPGAVNGTNPVSTTVIEKDIMPKDGVMSDVFAISPGDKQGAYKLSLYANGRVVIDQSFQVQ